MKLRELREEDLDMFLDLSAGERPATPEEIPLTTLAPAFLIYLWTMNTAGKRQRLSGKSM